MLSCLTIAPSDKGGDCGPLLRIVPEDAAKSGRRSDEDWAVVWGSGGWHPADIVCAAPGVVRAEAIQCARVALLGAWGGISVRTSQVLYP